MDVNTPILVTGGTGLLGSYLLRLLVRRGFTDVRAVCRTDSPFDLVEDVKDRITWLEGDLTDILFVRDAADGVERIYHCAAVVSYDSRDRAEMMRTNIESTANLVNAALDFTVEKFLHVSSIAALGRRKNLPVITEKTLWERSPMNSQYGISKHLSEREVWRGAAEGLTVAVVNPSVIIGGGFWHKSSGRFFRNIARGFPFYPTGGSGFVDVRDVADFMLRLMHSDLHGERYILNAENISYRHFFNLTAAVVNGKKPFIRVNSLIRHLAWRVEWLRARLTGGRSTITKESAENSARIWHFDNAKSLAAFPDFKYRAVKDTVRDTGDLFLQTKEKGYGVLPV